MILKRYNLVVVVFLLVFSGCYNLEKQKKPDHLLSKDQMSHIIIDLSIAAAAKGINKKKIDELAILPRELIFNKHHIDSTIFANNNAYYSYDLNIYEEIYKSVRDSLAILKKTAENNSYKKLDKTNDLKMKNELKIRNGLKNNSFIKKRKIKKN